MGRLFLLLARLAVRIACLVLGDRPSRAAPQVRRRRQGEASKSHSGQQMWQVHDLMQVELHERRARAATMFAVAAGILVSLIAAGLTGSLRDVSAVVPVTGAAFLAIIAYSVLAVIAAFFGLNPGLPWERERSIEGVAWLLSRLIGATAPKASEASFRDAYDGPLGYRLYARHAIRSEPLVLSGSALSAIQPDDLVLRTRTLALQIHQYRMWRRVVSAVVAVQFALMTLGAMAVLAIRFGVEPVTVLATIGVAVLTFGVVLAVAALGGDGRRIAQRSRTGADSLTDGSRRVRGHRVVAHNLE